MAVLVLLHVGLRLARGSRRLGRRVEHRAEPVERDHAFDVLPGHRLTIGEVHHRAKLAGIRRVRPEHAQVGRLDVGKKPLPLRLRRVRRGLRIAQSDGVQFEHASHPMVFVGLTGHGRALSLWRCRVISSRIADRVALRGVASTPPRRRKASRGAPCYATGFASDPPPATSRASVSNSATDRVSARRSETMPARRQQGSATQRLPSSHAASFAAGRMRRR